jgi:hypothetical protein
MAIDIQNFSKAKPPLEERGRLLSPPFQHGMFLLLIFRSRSQPRMRPLGNGVKMGCEVVDSHPVASARLLAGKTDDVCGALLIKQTKFELNI